MLRRPLQSASLEDARPAITRWVKTVLVYQTAVVLVAAGYVALIATRHPSGLAWTAPPVGAVIGTALPLQLAVMTIMRMAGRL